jgi:hypothetical protein
MKVITLIPACRACVPLFTISKPSDGDEVRFLGSGALVCYYGHYLVVTAAHVIDKNPIIMIAGPQEPLLLGKRSGVTGVWESLPVPFKTLDLDVIELDTQTASSLKAVFHFIDWAKVKFANPLSRAQPHIIIGYPAHANRARAETGTLTVNVISVDVMEDRKAICHAKTREIKQNQERYIGLRYNPRLLVKRDARPKIKSFQGFSGGLVWHINGPDCIGFSGIVVECESPTQSRTGCQIIYGIRAKTIDSLLAAYYQS